MESLSPREPARSRDGRPFSLCRRATSEARHHELLKQASEHRRRLPAKHSGLAQGNGKCPALASLSAVHAWSQDNLQRCIDHLVGCQRVCTSHKAVKTSASLIEPMVVDTPRRDAFNTTTTRAMGKRVAVLPDYALQHDRRFLRLAHPSLGVSVLYAYLKERDELLEIQSVQETERCYFGTNDEVHSTPALNVFTPVDALFVVIAHLVAFNQTQGARRFHAPDELWHEIATNSETSEDASRFGQLPCAQRALERCCDVQDQDGSKYYRYSETRALEQLRGKVDKLVVDESLWGSLDSSKFDDKAKGAMSMTLSKALGREGVDDVQGLSEAVLSQARTRATIALLSNYMPESLVEPLRACYNYDELEKHLQNVAGKGSAILSANYMPGGKRRANDFESEAFGDKDRKGKQPSKKKQKTGSRGVEMLKKVNTKNMKRLDSFFTASAPKK